MGTGLEFSLRWRDDIVVMEVYPWEAERKGWLVGERMTMKRTLMVLFAAGLMARMASAALFTVAASNTPEPARSRADFICDGTDDQVELAASIEKGPHTTAHVTDLGRYPVGQPFREQVSTYECLGASSVEWLPGDYHLGSTLVIPETADLMIQAQGTRFHYEKDNGDAVVVAGAFRSRYSLGTIYSNSRGAALRMKPDRHVLMSVITFTGLVGKDFKGVGLWIDQSVCTNRFEGTDISLFDKGVFVNDADTKVDTNWFWLSYIRTCRYCIYECGKAVDCNTWDVNVDASMPGSVAIYTAATYSSWNILMGTWVLENTNALILAPGASHQIIQIRPPIDAFRWQDNSGNDSNVVLCTSRKPLREASREELRTYWNRAGGQDIDREAWRKEVEERFNGGEKK